MRALCAAFFLCALAGPAWSRGYESLGTLERESADAALAERGLVIEPAPDGKPIGHVHVVNHEVFSPKDGHFQVFNFFHRTTREGIIRREVLLQPGDAYDQELVEETVRNLRDVDFSSLVAILPVKSDEPGRVDLLVVTRDVWSLRLNTDFDFQDGKLIYLTTSLSENNLFGWRKRFSFVYNFFRASYSLGPSYVDSNVLGTRLQFSASYRAIFTRGTNEKEGGTWGARLTYPLFSLASKWGASTGASWSDGVARAFDVNGIRPVDLESTAAVETLPHIYRVKSGNFDAQVTRSFPGAIIHRVSLGHRLSTVRPSFTADFPSMNQVERDGFAREVFPRSERISSLFLAYSVFVPNYRVYRDYNTFDLREDFYVGPQLSTSISPAAGWLGSEVDHLDLSLGVGWSFDFFEGYQWIGAQWGGRVFDGRLTDQNRTFGLTLATPMLARAVRLVAEGGLRVLLDNTRRNVYLTAGAESGLRGYAIGEFGDLGSQARLVTHFEARSAPLAVGPFRLGSVAFVDAGHAAARFEDLRIFTDVGVGLRLLIPQLNYDVVRVDWAFALQQGRFTQPGWPGRISAGFRQVF